MKTKEQSLKRRFLNASLLIGLTLGAATARSQLVPIPLNYQRAGNQVVLSWTNAAFGLQSAANVHGPFANVPGATSPHTNLTSGAQRYFRLLGVDVPTGMALIPAGAFTMGDSFDDWPPNWAPDWNPDSEIPIHTVYVSAFYMDKYEVTMALWDEVYQWAIINGYDFWGGVGHAANHPAYAIEWYDAVKWCNARSEQQGRVPAYYTSAAQTMVYRSGQVIVQNDWVKWNSGYRLPTEAEWEKAARGGASGQRFPWGNTITHSQANYHASPLSAEPVYGYAYDVNPTRGYHPAFVAGGEPSSSPVGYFAPNGYGLYGMAGNVWEWCWDWYGAYSNDAQTDPRGPASGSYRVGRGGSCADVAILCRVAYREERTPAGASGLGGFRSVLSPFQ